jgi:hypothetical protein
MRGRLGLIIAGDVSGKGLKAAMLVTLIVGMLERGRSNRPGQLLFGTESCVEWTLRRRFCYLLGSRQQVCRNLL